MKRMSIYFSYSIHGLKVSGGYVTIKIYSVYRGALQSYIYSRLNCREQIQVLRIQ